MSVTRAPRPYAVETWYGRADAALAKHRGDTPRPIGYSRRRGRFATTAAAIKEAEYHGMFLNPGDQPPRVTDTRTGKVIHTCKSSKASR